MLFLVVFEILGCGFGYGWRILGCDLVMVGIWSFVFSYNWWFWDVDFGYGWWLLG